MPKTNEVMLEQTEDQGMSAIYLQPHPPSKHHKKNIARYL